MDEPLNSWFKREILAHEEALLRYLTRVWPRRDDVTDLRQETYARVYEAAMSARPISAKAFLFRTAHHLMADRLRRERVVSIEAVGDIDVLNVLIDEVSPEQRVIAREELKRLARGFDLLPPRCREVVWMRRVQELSQKEVAERLRIDEKTVEKHVSKGGRMLAEHMFGGALTMANPQRTTTDSENDSEHGKQQKD